MQEYAYSTWYPNESRTRHILCRSPGSDPAAQITTSWASMALFVAPMISF